MPSKCAKDLGHATPLLFGVEVCCRGAQLGQHVVIELEVPNAAPVAVKAAVHTGHQLVDHDVDARHVLTAYGAEVVPGAHAQARVAVLILDNVADVLHAVRAAPVAELVAEALLIEGARDVHIDVAYVRAGRLAVPQVRELGQVALAQCRT